MKCIKSENTLKGNVIFIKEEEEEEELDEIKTSSPCPLICEVECAKFEYGDENDDTVDRLDVKTENIIIPSYDSIKYNDSSKDNSDSDDEFLISKAQKLKNNSKLKSQDSKQLVYESAENISLPEKKQKQKKNKIDSNSDDFNKSDDDNNDDDYFGNNDDDKNEFDNTSSDDDETTKISKSGRQRQSRARSTRIQCKFCRKTFFKQRTYELHLERHKKPGFKCNICANEFMTGGGLKEHIIRNHLNVSSFLYFMFLSSRSSLIYFLIIFVINVFFSVIVCQMQFTISYKFEFMSGVLTVVEKGKNLEKWSFLLVNFMNKYDTFL